jgi:hypothetical protein
MFNNDIKIGTVEGTGAIIQVEVGFIPKYVKLFNIDDAGTLWPTLEWVNGMAAASGFKGLKQIDSGTTGLSSQAYVTSNGISEFAGSVAGLQLTGTIAATAASATLTGTNTLFLTELKVGDVVKLGDGQELTVTAIASATSLTVAVAAAASVASKAANRIAGRAPGFLIGADADINAAAETIVYMAAR